MDKHYAGANAGHPRTDVRGTSCGRPPRPLPGIGLACPYFHNAHLVSAFFIYACSPGIVATSL